MQQPDALARIAAALGRAQIEREMLVDKLALAEAEIRRLQAENEGLTKEISGGVSD